MFTEFFSFFYKGLILPFYNLSIEGVIAQQIEGVIKSLDMEFLEGFYE